MSTMVVVTEIFFLIQALFKALHAREFQQRRQVQVSIDKVTVSSMTACLYIRDIFVGKLIDPYGAQICMVGEVQKEAVCQPYFYVDYRAKV